MTSPGCILVLTAGCGPSIPRPATSASRPAPIRETNRNAYDMIRHDTLFTNVALTADNQPWWEGLEDGTPVTDWQGRPYDQERDRPLIRILGLPSPPRNNPGYSPHAEDAAGVPISAIVFGGRRRELAPLVYQARNWAHGVLVGASVASETTAAATGQVGVVRRDPMAMQPSAATTSPTTGGIGSKSARSSSEPADAFSTSTGSGAIPAASFCGRAMAKTCACWPGCWTLRAAKPARPDTAIGSLPRPEDLNMQGLDIIPKTLAELTAVTRAPWRKELADLRTYLREVRLTAAADQLLAEPRRRRRPTS